jgi:chromosome segregation ATPase
METIEKLENSLGKLLETYRKLREENESLLRNARVAGEELEKAGETIRGLRADVERCERTDERFRDLEAKKNTLIEEIRAIIEKIDRSIDSNNIDMFTNA